MSKSIHKNMRRCEKCGTPFWEKLCYTCQITQLQSTIAELEKELDPIREWYGGGTEGNRPNVEILASAITDLQEDRREVLDLRAENKALKLKHTIEICYACSKFREVPQIVSQIKAFTAELESYRWIPANKPPENLRDKPTEAAWKTWYETLDYEDEIPKAMQAEQIWLNEGSEVEYYRLLILPEQESGGKE